MGHRTWRVWAWRLQAAFSSLLYSGACTPERRIQRLSTDEARVRVLAADSQQTRIFCSNEVLFAPSIQWTAGHPIKLLNETPRLVD